MRVHDAVQAHMIDYFNRHTSCRATREPKMLQGDDKRADVRIATLDGGTQDTIVDISHTCPTGNLSMPSAAARCPAVDFRGNHVPRADIPLFAARKREEEKENKYSDLARNLGCAFAPYVVETTGGLGPKTSTVIGLLKQYAHSRPAARTARFLQEQACIRATAYAHQVQETARTLRGGRIGIPAIDPTLPDEREASASLDLSDHFSAVHEL